MINQDIFFRSLSFWRMGLKYLHLARVTAERIVSTKNRTVATWWGERGPEEEAKELGRQTKWSDARLVEPLLFNFYHGLELLLKEFALWKSGPHSKLDHRLTVLLDSFMKEYPGEGDLIMAFQKYLAKPAMPEMLRDFLEKNGCSVNQLYESLRYPFNRDMSQIYEHIMLKYKGYKGIPFYEELVTDIGVIAKCAVALGRDLEGSSEQQLGQVSCDGPPSDEPSS
jgi:hypothetical protein